MKRAGQNAYTGTYERLPPWWGEYLSRNLFRVSHAPGYAHEPEQQPVCRQYDRCEGCPYPGHASFAGEAKMTVCGQELNRSEKENIPNKKL